MNPKRRRIRPSPHASHDFPAAPTGAGSPVLPGNHESHEEMTRILPAIRIRRFSSAGAIPAIRSRRTSHLQDSGYSNITPFNTPGEYTGRNRKRPCAVRRNSSRFISWSTFRPRIRSLTNLLRGKHAGSPALREWVERVQPDYLFCGHIHETAGLIDSARRYNVLQRR